MNLQKEENAGCSSKEESIQNAQHCMKHASLKRSLSMEQSSKEVPIKNIKTIADVDVKKVSQSSLEAEVCLEVLIEEENAGCSSKEESIQNTQHCVKHTSLKRSLSMEQSSEEVPIKNIKTIADIDVKKISQSPLEAEICLEVLIEELQEKRKEVKCFRDKVYKLQKTVTDLRSLIKTLKDKLITNTVRNTLKVNKNFQITNTVH
ncbi:uncharacterized protein LOC105248068 [Camponotus floridanus]|uniref:uncharacterized protein LOC105248068 n=1 Tax=Camponotus floridanus TaxID=104421 RepID=UPI000DC6C509|nr:uncharacterized protein LOC105248068 [Camponotus floridanus]